MFLALGQRLKSAKKFNPERFARGRIAERPLERTHLQPSRTAVGKRLGKLRAEFAGGQGIEGAKAVGKLAGGQAAVAVELAEMIRSGAFAFQRIAFHACHDEVAVGIAPVLGAGDDVIEALLACDGPAEAIETHIALSGADGWAQPCVLEKIQFFQVDRGGPRSRIVRLAKVGPERANLAW